MTRPLDILYRGPLASCNYDCWYCPFGKTTYTRDVLDNDAACLQRFVAWVTDATAFQLRVLLTPWGEGMFLPVYQNALTALSHLPHVANVAIQTNGSGPLDWLDDVRRDSLSLWISFHPGEVPRAEFVARAHELRRRGVAFSVGVVGLREHFDEIEALRHELPDDTYVWINAYKDSEAYYASDEIAQLQAIDPWFHLNNQRHPSLGKPCGAGHTSISVDGQGDIRRCHFVGDVLGNLYDPSGTGLDTVLRPRPCPNTTCGCYIGYVHLPDIAAQLQPAFGRGLLARNPLPVE